VMHIGIEILARNRRHRIEKLCIDVTDRVGDALLVNREPVEFFVCTINNHAVVEAI
jgi:hypothetical protein